MISVRDIVQVKGEGGGLWEVDMAGTASPMVRLIQNKNAATWRMENRDNLILVQKAHTEDDELGPRFIPERGILD